MSQQRKWTPVFAAAWAGQESVVKYLLTEAGCRKDVEDVVSCWCFSV